MDWFVLRFCDWREEWRLCHAAWLCCFTANRRWTAGAWGEFCFSAWLLVKSWNRSWNRDFSRFHPILTISPDFNPISPIFDFFKRFNMQNMFWLIKSYDFTSQNTILTTLAALLFGATVREPWHRHWPPLHHRQRSSQTSNTLPLPRQVTLLPPSLFAFCSFLPPACRMNSVLHAGRGEGK